jgi:IS30 family transposase
MKSISQIANELNINKQKVYRFIKRNHISETKIDAGVMWYDEAAESEIKAYFENSDESDEAHQSVSKSHHDESLDALINMLQKELDSKNQQIDRLTQALSDTTKSLQASQALHAQAICEQKLLEEKKAKKPFVFKWFRSSAEDI